MEKMPSIPLLLRLNPGVTNGRAKKPTEMVRNSWFVSSILKDQRRFDQQRCTGCIPVDDMVMLSDLDLNNLDLAPRYHLPLSKLLAA